MKPVFDFCPKCKSDKISSSDSRLYTCPDCDFSYFHNITVAVGCILRSEDKIVLVRRAKDPKKGMLHVAGGFVDFEESAENALAREVKEELGVEISNAKYLASFPNNYEYKNIQYRVCDFFFTADALSSNFIKQDSEIVEVLSVNPKDINLDDFAFESVKNAIKLYLDSLDNV